MRARSPAWYGNQKSEYSAAELSAVASSGNRVGLQSSFRDAERPRASEANVNAQNVTMIAVAKDAADTAF